MYNKTKEILKEEIETIKKIDTKIRELENTLLILRFNMSYEFTVLEKFEDPDYWSNTTELEDIKNDEYNFFAICFKQVIHDDSSLEFRLLYEHGNHNGFMIDAPAHIKIIASKYLDEFLDKYIENVKRVLTLRVLTQ